MTSSEAEQQHLRERLRAIFAVGRSVGAGCRVVELRDAAHELVLLVRWRDDPRLYGVPIDLTDTSHEFYYSDYPVDSDEEWLDSVDLGMMIRMDTGFRVSARRAQVEDYIELREPGGWPEDNRFTLDVVRPRDRDSWLRLTFVADDGLDTEPAIATRDAGRLIAWITAYENNSSGSPYLGQAIVARSTATTADLEHLQVSDGVPVTLAVDLAYLAAHIAAKSGALRVTTDLDLPELALVGFKAESEGKRVLDCDFLDADPDGASELLRVSLESADRWGQDRDAAGRYLPPTKIGRWWHRLRHGPTGGRRRVYAG